MKRYYIVSHHDVYIDDYEKGELENVNYYNIKEFVVAETPREAIKKYFDEILCYSFSISSAIITHEEDDDEPINRLEYSVLVDDENIEASELERLLWKEGNKKLYSNNISLYIEELTPVKI